MSEHAVPWKHTLIKYELYMPFLHMHMNVTSIVKVTMAIGASDVFGLAVLFCSSVINGSVEGVKICCSPDVCS